MALNVWDCASSDILQLSYGIDWGVAIRVSINAILHANRIHFYSCVMLLASSAHS